MFYGVFYNLAVWMFGFDVLRCAHRKILTPENVQLAKGKERLAYPIMLALDRMGWLGNLRRFYRNQINPAQEDSKPVFNPELLHLKLNRIYDLPEVKIDPSRMRTLNVLVPAFEFKSMSAGFFGVFQVALFLRKTGWNVRLVLFDNFNFCGNEFRNKFREYPGMEKLLDELEVDYIGERKEPLKVSPKDTCLATVWYSAHFAKKIMSKIDGDKFLYLIQDYETNFFPGSSLSVVADETYRFNYAALFSSQSLHKFFLTNDIGGIKSRKLACTFFNNACSASLLKKTDFIKVNKRKRKRKIVFYSRPVVNRNMFELTALTLSEAFRTGIFDPKEWECIGMGLGDGIVDLMPGTQSISLPRMTLKKYQETVNQFDICLTLMASPHPSLIPMDLGGSGAIVVTNTFATKTKRYLRGICKNIIPSEPNLPDLLKGLKEASERVSDLDARHRNAREMSFPRKWKDSLGTEHLKFFKHEFGG